MGKYDPLAHYLSRIEGESVDVSFSQVEKILGFQLPNSAYRHQAWWANESHGSHSHSRSWQEAGWDTCQVNTTQRTVRFERRRSRPDGFPSPPTPNPSEARGATTDLEIEALISKATTVTGIEDRDALLKAALTALINRELAHYFASLGGSMPDFKPAPRERPFA